MNAMNDNEKIWFVKIGNSTNGPFSIEEMKQKVLSGELNPQQEARANGTSTWVPIQNLFSNTQTITTTTTTNIRNPSTNKSKDELSAFIVLNPDIQDQTSLIDRRVLKRAQSEADKVERIAGSERDKVMSKVLPPPKSKLPLIFFGLLFAIIISIYMYFKMASPIPDLKDLTDTELKELKLTAKMSFKNDGPKVATAVSSTSLDKPKFYIATNFSDGTFLELTVRPLSETLLQKPFEAISNKLIIKSSFAESPTITYKGSSLPIGEYLVEVKPSDSLNPLHSKRYFLGGTRDTTYESKLDNYHKQMKTVILSNLKGTRDIIDNLDQLYLMKTQTFLAGIKLTKQPRVLTKFWSSSSAKSKVQYQTLAAKFASVKSTANDKPSAEMIRGIDPILQSLAKLNSLQTSFLMDKAVNKSTLDQQIKATNEFISTRMQEVKSKQTITEKEVEVSDGYMEGANK